MAKKAEAVNLEPELWERQPDEGARAYEAFCLYRDMGASRSLRRVVRDIDKSLTTIGIWSSEHNWVERCKAWDAEQDRIAREAQLDEIRKMRERHAQLAMDMLEKVVAGLDHINPYEMSPNEMARIVDVASKLERISRGDVGEVVEERDGGSAPTPVTFYMPDNHRDTKEE